MAKGSHLVLVAHGSRRQSANQEVVELGLRLASVVSFDAVSVAFLELAEPSIADAIDRAIDAGATRVVVLPYFLSEGRHVSEDVPGLLEAASERHSNVDIVMTSYLGQSPVIVDVLKAMVEAVAMEDQAKPPMSLVGLRSAVDNNFPKTCRNCGRIYQNVDDFILDTALTMQGGGLKQGFTDEEQAIVELLRNCQCGSTLISPFYSRRSSSDLASECRHQFDKLVSQMAVSGKKPDVAREELRQVITGGYGDILEQLKKIARPRRTD